MLSDVHAAMNSRPSLVSAESCFITRTGDLELPVMTDIESPDAVTVLLREMLAGRDAPEALETLAFGHATRDMTGALQQFPIANRRAEIAKLATRALALQAQPLEPLATTPAPEPPAVSVQPPAPPVTLARVRARALRPRRRPCSRPRPTPRLPATSPSPRRRRRRSSCRSCARRRSAPQTCRSRRRPASNRTSPSRPRRRTRSCSGCAPRAWRGRRLKAAGRPASAWRSAAPPEQSPGVRRHPTPASSAPRS